MDKESLDKIFSRTNENGVYLPYQPIYGLRRGIRERKCYPMGYLLTHNILKALQDLEFSSVLDVGGAEGYTAQRIKDMFGCHVVVCELSPEACKRADEIFSIPADVGDITNLPYEKDQFDVVVCSEVLEHIENPKVAVQELLRVARKAVIITVPNDDDAVINPLSSHINNFNEYSFRESGLPVIHKKLFRWTIPYRILKRIGRHLKSKWFTTLLLQIDAMLPIDIFTKYKANLYVILKAESFLKPSFKDVSPYWVVDFSVPYHYLEEQ